MDRREDERLSDSVKAEADQRARAHGGADPLLAVLERMERVLSETRGRLEAAERSQRHREFSLARFAGALLQAVVVGLIIGALSDWAYEAPPAQQLVKLAFAGVLQLAALTAFIVARDSR